MDNNKVKQAEAMTRNADLDIVVIGEHSLRNNRYKKTLEKIVTVQILIS